MKKSIFFMLLITAVIAVWYGVRYVKTPVTTEIMHLIKYEESVRGDAFIIKKETVNTAQTDGTLYNYAANGSRVGKNKRIASVYTGNVNTSILQELNNVDKKIELLNVRNSTKQMSTSDTLSVESKISDRENEIINAVYTGDISRISSYKEEIKNLRNGTTDTSEKDSGEMLELEKQREKLEKKIGATRTDIFSQNSGIYISVTDGYETILTPDIIKDFKVSDFNTLNKLSKTEQKTTVTEGEAVSKIVDNHSWYAMVKIKANLLDAEYTVGKKVKIKFDAIPSSELECQIYNISEEENGELLLTVKCEKYLEGVFEARYTEADIILKDYTGYKVPVYAIRVRDGQKGVEVQRGLATQFKPCEVLYTDEENGFVIIDSAENSENPIEEMDLVYIGEK